MDDITIEKEGNISALPPVRYQIPNSPVIIAIVQVGAFLYRYDVIEPELNKSQIVLLDSVRDHILHLLRNKARSRKFVSDFSREFSLVAKESFPLLHADEIRIFEYYIRRDARGFGQVQPLIDDPSVTRVLINSPDRIISVHHCKYGTLPTSLQLQETQIVTLLRKICNRSTTPVEFTHLPPDITLRSGIRIHLSRTDNGSALPMFSIEKQPSKKENFRNGTNNEPSHCILTTYHLHRGIVEVKIIKFASGQVIYHIAMASLSPEEQSTIDAIIEKNKQRNRLKSSRKNIVQCSSEDFSQVVRQTYPGISPQRLPFLYAAFTFHQDMVRWIRAILQDPHVIRILCTHPGKPIHIWHTHAPEGGETSLIPNRTDLNRFAVFCIHCSGKEIDPDNKEVTLRFKTGEIITLAQVRDDQGHYYRFDISKSRSGQKESDKSRTDIRNRIKVSKISPSSPREDKKIEELLTKIFSREDGDKQKNTASEEGDGKDILSTQAGFARRILHPIRTGINEISLLGSRKKEKLNRDVAPIPETVQVESVLNVQIEEGVVAEEAYWLFQPHAYAVIVQDRSKDRSYRIIEPELSPRERIILEETHETLRDVLVYDKPVTRGDLFLEYGEVAKVVKTYDPKIGEDRLSVLYYYLRRNLNGYGKIDALMYDELLEDISCNGHDLPVYIHHRYYGSIPTSVRFESEELNRFVLKLSQKADKQVSLTSPLLDASLPNGARAQITYSDVVSTKGSSFTIRKFRSDPMTPATLLAFGTYSDELLAFIWLALENRQSLIVVGGTASGKTSAMNAFSFFIPHNSKIVSLEDTREIQIPQKNWLPVQTRASNSFSDRGSVDLFDLLKASLRQRPEYIIVGEVRGNEAQTLFQAMNSGHTTLSTLHAGNIEEALNRLTNEPINVPPAMFGALNLMVIQTFHYRGGRMIRRCDAIHEILLGDDDKVKWNTLFEYEPTNDSFRRMYSISKTLQTIRYMHNWSEEEMRYQLDLRAGFLAKLRNQYSTDPEVLMRMITDVRRLA